MITLTATDVSLIRDAATRHRRLAKGCRRPHERARHVEKADAYDDLAGRLAALWTAWPTP